MPRTWDGTAWVDDPAPPGVEWGDIGGTLADQPDLDAALDGKADAAHAASHADGGADEVSVAASQVTSGVLDVARGGTGLTTSDLTGQAGKTVAVNGAETGYELAAPSGGGGVGERVWIPIPSPWSAQSGSVSVVASSSQMYAVVAFGSGVGHYYQWSTRLTGGTWAMHLLFGRTTTGGIITPSVAGVDLATIDTYNSSTTPNIPATYSGLVVASSAVVPIRFRVDAKNPSSSAYESRINGLWLERTA